MHVVDEDIVDVVLEYCRLAVTRVRREGRCLGQCVLLYSREVAAREDVEK